MNNQLALFGVWYVKILVSSEHLLQILDDLFMYLIHIGCIRLITLYYINGGTD